MPELRRDPVVDRWVIIAPERADRPNALLREYQLPDDEDGCPFCPGNEFLTPPEIAALREQGRWTWRIVPNRYPAVRTEENMSRKGIGVFDKMAGVGAHEVIIETDSPRQPLHQLPLPRAAAPRATAAARPRRPSRRAGPHPRSLAGHPAPGHHLFQKQRRDSRWISVARPFAAPRAPDGARGAAARARRRSPAFRSPRALHLLRCPRPGDGRPVAARPGDGPRRRPRTLCGPDPVRASGLAARASVGVRTIERRGAF